MNIEIKCRINLRVKRTIVEKTKIKLRRYDPLEDIPFDDIFEPFVALKKMSATVFQKLKSPLRRAILKCLKRHRKSNRGPKVKVDFYKMLDAVYELVSSGSQYAFVAGNHGTNPTALYRCLKFIAKNQLFEKIHRKFLEKHPVHVED